MMNTLTTTMTNNTETASQTATLTAAIGGGGGVATHPAHPPPLLQVLGLAMGLLHAHAMETTEKHEAGALSRERLRQGPAPVVCVGGEGGGDEIDICASGGGPAGKVPTKPSDKAVGATGGDVAWRLGESDGECDWAAWGHGLHFMDSRLTVFESSGDGDMSIKATLQKPTHTPGESKAPSLPPPQSSPPLLPPLFARSPVATVTVATGSGAWPAHSPPKPAPVHLGQGWIQYFDDDMGRSYYRNYCTNAAVQWLRPPGL